MKYMTARKLFGRARFVTDPAGGAEPGNPPGAGVTGSGGGTPNQTPPAVDYDKIQQMLSGTLQAKEETALKAYFKQQGLSQEEMIQAITAFKQQKAAQQPDVGALQAQAEQAQKLAQQAQIESAATIEAVSLGIDVKTIPYVLKMADLSQVVGQDGKVNIDALKNALNKVLEDIPALKPQTSQNGFVQVGTSGQQQTQNTDEALKKAFGL